jgi:hypothetical protein
MHSRSTKSTLCFVTRPTTSFSDSVNNDTRSGLLAEQAAMILVKAAQVSYNQITEPSTDEHFEVERQHTERPKG